MDLDPDGYNDGPDAGHTPPEDSDADPTLSPSYLASILDLDYPSQSNLPFLPASSSSSYNPAGPSPINLGSGLPAASVQSLGGYSLLSHPEQELANSNDEEEAPVNAIHLALYAMSSQGTTDPFLYPPIDDPGEDFLQGEFIDAPGTVSLQFQGLQNLQASQGYDSDDESLPDAIAGPPPQPSQDPLPPPSIALDLNHPNPNTLGTEHLQLFLFLRRWVFASYIRPTPDLNEVEAQACHPEKVVRYKDLEADSCDMQGLNWSRMGTTRQTARAQRLVTYKNYVNRPQSDVWKPSDHIEDTSNFFRFQRMDIKQNVYLAHFQLRNVLSCVSRSLAFYPGRRAIHQINPVSGKCNGALDLKDVPAIQISTLSARHGALIVGGFMGDYYVKSIDSIQEQKPGYHEGQLKGHASGITNHVQIYQGRTSGSPAASFASNDTGFRTVDIPTDRIISETHFEFPINCSTLSPDRRLRVLVGDHSDVLICNSETNKVLQRLQSHKDFGFACDWSENGWSVATGFQDMMIKIWDARRWTDSNGNAAPLSTIRANMAGARSLRFSPLGSGKPVLIAAEEADFLNMIDAETYSSRQVVDIFGEIGGIDFVNAGRDLMVLCGDQARGGLLRFERTRDVTVDLYGSGSDEVVENCYWKRTSYAQQRHQLAWPADVDGF